MESFHPNISSYLQSMLKLVPWFVVTAVKVVVGTR